MLFSIQQVTVAKKKKCHKIQTLSQMNNIVFDWYKAKNKTYYLKDFQRINFKKRLLKPLKIVAN